MLDQERILTIVRGEIDNAETAAAGDLQGNREEALDYYLGNLPGPAPEGRSQVVSTDVADAIEWTLPQIIESLIAHGSPVAFDALSPNDENQADLETEFTHYTFMSENQGFLNLYTSVKDALLQKNGIWKIWFDDTPETAVERYEGLSPMELQRLQADPDLEILEVAASLQLPGGPQGEAGPYPDQGMGMPPMGVPGAGMASVDVVCERTTSRGRVRVEPVPPESFLVNPDHDSTDLSDARFTCHRVMRTVSDLITAGYDAEVVMQAASDGNSSYDADYRFSAQGESGSLDYESEDESQRLVQVHECYLRLDASGTGVAELTKVTLLGDDVILDMEPIERVPFVGFSCIIMPHKFYGLSLHDRLAEIQKAKTSLWRNILDNLYLQNNREKEVVEGQVNLDDLLISRPGGIKRVRTPGSIRELQVQPIGAEGFNMLQYFDAVRTGRAGVSPDTQGQDLDVGNETAHGVERVMTAKEKLTGLMIRAVAETGLKPAYRLIRDLLVSHKNGIVSFKHRDQWQQVDPSQWGKRSRMSVKVGTGTGDDMRKVQALTQVLAFQAQVMANPAQALVDQPQIYAALDDFCDAAGIGSGLKYFLDPQSPQGQQKQQQVAQSQQQQSQQQAQLAQAMAQAQAQLAQAEQMKGQASIATAQARAQTDAAKVQLDQQKAIHQAEIERMKLQIDQLQAEVSAAEGGQKLQLEYAKLATDKAIRLTELELQAGRDLNADMRDNARLDRELNDDEEDKKDAA